MKISPQWRGGWYYAVKRKNGGELALVMVTKWANAEAASDFASVRGDVLTSGTSCTGGSAGAGGQVCLGASSDYDRT